MATAASIQAVQEAYIAYYGRPGDPAGIDFWAERLDAAGGNTSAMISAFGTSAEASARYASLSVTDAVNAIYNQVLGRDAEAGATGIDFYVNKVLSGEFTLVTLAQNIWDGATSGTDAQTVANKLTAANSFTQTLRDDAAANTAYSGTNAAGNARNWLAEVDSTEASVTAQTAAIATTIESIAESPANPGSTFTLTSADTDSLTGTSSDDTFDATTVGTLSSGDIIIDASTSDNDVLNAVLATTATTPKVTNVETVNVTAQYLTGGIDITNFTGVDTVNVNAGLPRGTLTVANVNSVNAASIVAGDNVGVLNVSSLTSGTRDGVSVNINNASAVITGSAGNDIYDITVGVSGSLTLATIAANDTVTIRASESFSLTNGASTLTQLNLNMAGTGTVTVSTGLATSTTVISDYDVVLSAGSGASTLFGSLKINSSGAGSLTLNVGSAVTTNLSGADVDYVKISQANTNAAATYEINASSVLQLAGTVGQALTIELDSVANTQSYSAGLGALIVEVQENQTASLTTGTSVGTLLVRAVADEVADNPSGSALTLSTVTLDANTNVILADGSEDLRIAVLANNNDETLDARTMTGALELMQVSAALTAYTGSGDDYVSGLAASGTLDISTFAGADSVFGSDNVDTIDLGDGDDTVDPGPGIDVVTLGSGSDVIRYAIGDGEDIVSDFVKGVDKIILTGGSAVDVTNLTVTTSGNYTLGAAGLGTVTLTGNTGASLSDSIQLGLSTSATYDLSSVGSASVTAGELSDFITIASQTTSAAITLTTGSGSDVVLFNVAPAGVGSAGALAATISDFTLGTDKLIVYGTASDVLTLDIHSGTVSSGAFSGTFGSAAITLTGVTTKDVANSVQFGFSGTTANSYDVGSASTVTLSDFNDYVTLASTAEIIIKDGGGFDWVEVQASAAILNLNYDSLTGICSGTNAVGMAANATKVSDAVSGSIYVFANGEDGAGSSALEYTGSGASAATLDNVATFISANLGTSDGERYVVIINDISGEMAYSYYVNVAGTLDSGDITLITQVDLDLLTGDVISTSDIA